MFKFYCSWTLTRYSTTHENNQTIYVAKVEENNEQKKRPAVKRNFHFRFTLSLTRKFVVGLAIFFLNLHQNKIRGCFETKKVNETSPR